MKTTILVAFLVGIAVAVSDKKYEKFRAGKEYQYELNTQSVTGIPHTAAQFSGVAYRAQCKLQISRNSRTTLQCSNIKFYEINDVVDKIPTHQFLPDHYWKPMDQDAQTLYQECLSSPIIFRYDAGMIESLEVPKDEPEWCSNMKKGVVSIFQMDLTQQNQLQDVEPKMADLLERNRVFLDTRQDQMFSSMESDFDGDCESLYVVREPSQHSITSDDSDDMKITKVRNYDNCRMRVKSEEGILSTYVADVKNAHNNTGMRMYTHSNATVQGNRREFVIRQVDQLSEIIYTPMGEESGEVTSLSLKRLQLREVRDIVSVITPQQTTRVLTEGLKMTFKDQQQEPKKQSTNQPRTDAIKQLCEDYSRESATIVTRKTMQILANLMYNLRECSAEDIITVVRTYRQQTNNRALKVLLDCIPTIGRPHAIQVMKFLIEEETFVQQEAATMMNYIALTIKPTAYVVEQLLPKSPLFNLRAVRNNRQLRQTILLAAGTVHHGLVKAQESEPIPEEQFNQIKREFITQMEDFYKQSSDVQDKITVMKTIGNCGLPDFISFVQQELNNEDLPTELRRNAVYAFRRMPFEVKQVIHKILVPLYMNPNNEYGLRVVAYLATIKTEPTYATLQTFVHSLQEEKSERVGKFVYSHLVDIMESSRQSLNNTRHYVTLLMKKAKPFITEKFYTNTYSFDYLTKDLRLGEYLDLYVMDSAENKDPSALAAVFGQTLYGREVSVLESGIGMNGLKDILNRLMGPKSIVTELYDEDSQLTKDLREIVDIILNRQSAPDMGKVDSLVRDIARKLGLSERQAEELNASAYLKVLGNEMRFGMFESKDIISYMKQYARTLVDDIQQYIDELEKEVMPDYSRTMATQSVLIAPTILGIPCYFNASYAHTLRLTGKARINANPMDKEDKSFKLNVELHPSASVMLTGSIGLCMPLRRYGVQLQTSLDFNTKVPVEMSYDQQSSNWELKYFIPKQQYDMFTFQAVPVTHIDKLSKIPSYHAYVFEGKEIQNKKFIKPFVMQVPYETPSVGAKFIHKVQVPTPILGFAPIRPFTGRHEWSCQMQPLSQGSNDPYVHFVFQATSQKQSRSQEYDSYRTSYRSQDSEDLQCGQLPPVESHPQLKNIKNKRSMCLSVETKNTPNQRQCWSQLTIQSDEQQHYQVNLQSQAQPNTYSSFINIFLDFYKTFYPTKSEPEGELVWQVEAGYGKTTPTEKYGSVKVMTGDRNAELRVPSEPLTMFWMRKWFNVPGAQISKQGLEERDSWLSWFSDESEEYKKQDDNTQFRATTNVPEFRSYAYKYTIEADYEKVPDYVRNYIYYCYQGLRYWNEEWVADLPQTQQTPSGKINAIVRFMPSLEKLHVLVSPSTQTYETVFWCPARLPRSLKRALTLDTKYIFPEQDREEEDSLKDSHQDGKVKCSISQKDSKDKVKTFDGLEYELMDLPDCEVLLAKDCSPSKLFTILMSKKQRDGKALRILLPNSQIDVTVQNQQLKVDGKNVPLYEQEKKIEYITISNKQIPVELKKTDEGVEVKVKSLGLEVSIKRTKVEIKSSGFYSGELCGLCGDYNGDIQREMTGARNKLHRDVKPWILSYVLPSDTCDVDSLHRQHSIQSGCERKRSNIILTKEIGSRKQTCVSIEPQDTQNNDCDGEQQQQSVHFLCMEPDSFATRRLIKDIQRQPQDLSDSIDITQRPNIELMRVPIPYTQQ